jgi:SAM-dependent methyltransferase
MVSNSQLHYKIDYGIDAPGIRKGMFYIAIVGLVLLFLTYLGRATWFNQLQILSVVLFTIASIITMYGTFMCCYMTYSSKIGKLITRNFLLDQVPQYLQWEDVTQALDIGCGKGLFLIGAAKRISKGVSIGVDIWSNNDQSNNHENATKLNASLEGIAQKVQILTADARKLPFNDESMDVIMSHWVVHNIDTEIEQLKALDEMYRVLKPGGVIVLADIQQVKKYLLHFEMLGLVQVHFYDGGFEAKVMSILSGGTYIPQSFIGMKPLD